MKKIVANIDNPKYAKMYQMNMKGMKCREIATHFNLSRAFTIAVIRQYREAFNLPKANNGTNTLKELKKPSKTIKYCKKCKKKTPFRVRKSRTYITKSGENRIYYKLCCNRCHQKAARKTPSGLATRKHRKVVTRKKECNTLHNNYILKLLADSTNTTVGQIRALIPNDLIEAKRNQILLERTLNKQNHDKSRINK